MTLYGLCSYYEDEDPKFFHSKQAKIEGINSQMRNITIRRFRGVMRELEEYKIKESARNCLLN